MMEKIYIDNLSNKEVTLVLSSVMNKEYSLVAFRNFKIDEEKEIVVEKMSFSDVKKILEENESKFLKIKSLNYRKEVR